MLDKLRNGEPFDGWAPEVVAQRDLVAQVLQRVSTAPLDQRADLYSEILGGLGDGSVVTRDIPPDSLALGAPARVIRSLTSEPPA